jgi:hypothetical protein
MVQKQSRKLPFWIVFATFLLSQSALLSRGVNSQNDETEGTTTEITINRAIEIGKLFKISPLKLCEVLKERKILITELFANFKLIQQTHFLFICTSHYSTLQNCIFHCFIFKIRGW